MQLVLAIVANLRHVASAAESSAARYRRPRRPAHETRRRGPRPVSPPSGRCSAACETQHRLKGLAAVVAEGPRSSPPRPRPCSLQRRAHHPVLSDDGPGLMVGCDRIARMTGQGLGVVDDHNARTGRTPAARHRLDLLVEQLADRQPPPTEGVVKRLFGESPPRRNGEVAAGSGSVACGIGPSVVVASITTVQATVPPPTGTTTGTTSCGIDLFDAERTFVYAERHDVAAHHRQRQAARPNVPGRPATACWPTSRSASSTWRPPGKAGVDLITEVGAVMRGGACLGTFQTLVIRLGHSHQHHRAQW